jgi:pimeloyl-ACP methyl ester carboxylesterase
MAMTRANRRPRLPRAGRYTVFRGPLGDVLFRPWLDPLALRTVVQGYLPLSRAWAAALVAQGDSARFFAELPGPARQPAATGRALAKVVQRGSAHNATAARWEAGYFGAAEGEPEDLVALELARHRASHRLMAARSAFLPLLGRLPPVKWQVTGPEEVAAGHAARLDDPKRAFPMPESVPVEASRTVAGADGAVSWLRYRAPVLGDAAWARVSAPEGVPDPPTLISLHGICMEPEMWRGLADPLAGDAAARFRVISPEGPWHGRRRLAGWYGGEPIMAWGPRGLIELFQAWVAEVAVLVRWARQTGRGPVAVGGVSLGALTAQLVAVAAKHWPAEVRPDALYLVGTSGALLDITENRLARAVGLGPRIAAAGWTRETLRRWLPLLEPAGSPAMAAEKVVMVLGARDDVTPPAGGLALARFWGVPDANLFLRRQGHFSVALGLMHDPAPLRRLTAILGFAAR